MIIMNEKEIILRVAKRIATVPQNLSILIKHQITEDHARLIIVDLWGAWYYVNVDAFTHDISIQLIPFTGFTLSSKVKDDFVIELTGE